MIFDRKMILDRQPVYFAAVVAVLVLVAGLAVTFAYISPDSWYYMLLARSLRHGHGCGIAGDYMGVYPCGYPTVLALTAPSAELPWLMISSKVTNLLLLGISFLFVWKASRHVLMATFLILNPITLLIGMYTWSENLLLFCFCGTLYGLARLDANGRNPYNYVFLALILIIGCFTRYFFGPFAFLLFLGAWLAFGSAVALRALPCFAAAGIAYLGYQQFNRVMTGYATGMERIAAPEKLDFIIREFFTAIGSNLIYPAFALALLLALCWWQLRPSRDRPAPVTRAASVFVMAAGVSFLGLAFALRAGTLFDPFDTRTIGYGLVFLAAGLIGRFLHMRRETAWPVLAVLASGVFSAIYADGTNLPLYLTQMMHGQHRLAATHMAGFQAPGPPADIVVFFDVPDPDPDLGRVDNTQLVYYGEYTTFVSPTIGPDDTPETAAEFLEKLDSIGHRSCYFDFTIFGSRADFADYVSSSTVVDTVLSTRPGAPRVLEQANFDPGLSAYLMSVVQPGRRVPCAEILDMPASRAVMAQATRMAAPQKTAMKPAKARPASVAR